MTITPVSQGFYAVRAGSDEERDAVRSALPELDDLSPPFAEAAVTAWVTAWRSGTYPSFAEIPMGPVPPSYPLVEHVRDVTITGLEMARVARESWQRDVNDEVLLAAFLLHDVDKPLIYGRTADGAIAYTEAGRALPHGVLGAMILRELGFPDEVTSIVATHAGISPFHVVNVEAWVLYYADLFATDHAMLATGCTPLYQTRR